MKDQIEIDELKEFLSKNKNIPTVKTHFGFLEMIKKQHNENINSNLYAFFLACEDNHIKNVFIESLLDLVNQKSSKHIQLSHYLVETEVTNSKGRIDIVIQDLINESTLIIENKIFHDVHNPLKDYWNHFKIADKKKVGILLTPTYQKVPVDAKDYFINITHRQWISEIEKRLDFNKIQENTFKIYLTDFINTVKNMSTNYQLNASAKFFFENAEKINQINNTIDEGHRFMNEQYHHIASKLGLAPYGNSIEWKNFWDEENTIYVYLTVLNENIIKGKDFKYRIVIELFGDIRDNYGDLKKKFRSHTQIDGAEEREQDKSKYFKYLVIKEYETSLDRLGSFADDVVKHIEEDFWELFVKVVHHLYKDKLNNDERWQEEFKKINGEN